MTAEASTHGVGGFVDDVVSKSVCIDFTRVSFLMNNCDTTAWLLELYGDVFQEICIRDIPSGVTESTFREESSSSRFNTVDGILGIHDDFYVLVREAILGNRDRV